MQSELWTENEAREYLTLFGDSDDVMVKLVCRLIRSLLRVVDAERQARITLVMENVALKNQLSRKEE